MQVTGMGILYSQFQAYAETEMPSCSSEEIVVIAWTGSSLKGNFLCSQWRKCVQYHIAVSVV